MAAQYIFSMHKLSRFHPPDREVLKDISLSFFPGAKIGVIGHNGSGKSTLLRIMAGLDDGFSGEARLTAGFTVGLLEQEPRLEEGRTVIDNVLAGLGETSQLLREYEDLLARWSDPSADFEQLGEQQAELEARIDAAGAWDLQRTIDIAMDALRLPPAESAVDDLSGGEVRRVALCRLLLARPDLLLLDEPTNHLDAESVAWLERTLRDYKGTVVAITHDRYFLDNVAEWILELDRGRGIPYHGNYSGWLEQKQQRLDKEEKSDAARRRTLERELEWVRMAPKARQAKSKARLSSYEKLLAEADSSTGNQDKLQIVVPSGERLGDQVIEANGISKGFGDRLLIDDLTFSLPRAGIVGVIGPNGAGKTTLFRMIVEAADARSGEGKSDPQGRYLPDEGSLTVGPTVQLAYVDQNRDVLGPDNTVYEEITGGRDHVQLGRREVNGRAYVAAFNFKGASQQARVGDLSGGERNRVHLAKMLTRGGNVLLLDEPTNDLDVDTLRSLEDALDNYAGCAVIISHDRWFLDRVATHTLAFEGDSQVRWFEGNVSEYSAWRRKEFGADAEQPHRIKYKPLVRG